MTTIRIPQKPSNTGSIHDINSDMYDIDIRMRGGCKYAVGTAAYYNITWTTHRTLDAALRAARRLRRIGGYNAAILGSDGTAYDGYGHKDYDFSCGEDFEIIKEDL
jgi:hypothetical protein